MRHIVLIALIVMGCGGSASATFRSQAIDTFEKTVPFAPGGHLLLENENGGIDVRSWDKEEVQIYARIKVEASDREEAEALLKEVQIRVETQGDRIAIYTEKPREFFGRNRNAAVSYELVVPEKISLDLRTVNGGVRVDTITGEVLVSTTNGGIEVDRISGAVEAHTTNGGIDVDLMAYNGASDLEFRTTNGTITVTLPKDVKGTLEAETTNGHIEVDFPVTIQGRFSKKSIQGELNGGGPALIRLRTTNGSIHLREAF
jgi:DUF4097 and DUF4098 domain-containing protein YvlB